MAEAESSDSPALRADALSRYLFQRVLVDWWYNYGRLFPWRRFDQDPYHVFVAEFLVRRTTAVAASRVYLGFLAQYPRLSDTAAASVASLERVLAPIGLCHQRAVGIRCAASHILDHYGTIPSDLRQLESVPNLGPYSARAILSFAFGKPYAVVDSNVTRIVSRYLLTPKPSLALVQQFVDSVVPKKNHQVYNWAMLDLGAVICRYGSPKCSVCPLINGCKQGLPLVSGANCFQYSPG